MLLHSHVLLFWNYIIFKLLQSIDAHSSYDLPIPFNIWNILPGMDSSKAHYLHHCINTGNYGGYFIFWDWLCNTQIHCNIVNNNKL